MPVKGEDKLLSVNDTMRKVIGRYPYSNFIFNEQ